MTEEEPNPNSEPPLVFRVEEELPLVLPVVPPSPKRPRPGFGEAVVWCVVFLSILHGGTIAVAGAVWLVNGLLTGNLNGFVEEEVDGLRVAGNASRQGEDILFPSGLSNAIAWGMLLGQVLALFFVWLVLRRIVGRDWQRQLAFHRPPTLLLLLAAIATPGLMILHGGVHELVHAAFHQPMSSDTGNTLKGLFDHKPWPFAVLAVGLFPGILEELFCRGFLGRGLVSRNGFLVGVVLTSFLFGVLHILPLYALGTMFMGLCLHFTYLVSRSLWVPIFIHAFNNSVTILATIGVIELGSLEQDAAGLGPGVYVASLIAVGSAFTAMWTGRVRLVPIDSAQPVWMPAFLGVELPPPGSNAAPTARRPSVAFSVVAVIASGVVLWFLIV